MSSEAICLLLASTGDGFLTRRLRYRRGHRHLWVDILFLFHCHVLLALLDDYFAAIHDVHSLRSRLAFQLATIKGVIHIFHLTSSLFLPPSDIIPLPSYVRRDTHLSLPFLTQHALKSRREVTKNFLHHQISKYSSQKIVNLHYSSAFFCRFMHYFSAILLYLQQKYNDYGYFAY